MPVEPLNRTGNVLIDQLRHDLQTLQREHRNLHGVVISLQADVARLQNRLSPPDTQAGGVQHGHALTWERAGANLIGLDEFGDGFAVIDQRGDHVWRLRFYGDDNFVLFEQKSEAIDAAQRQYVKGLQP